VTLPAGFAPHPEGGAYREIWRSAARAAGRDAVTAILFHLAPGESSAWHRLHGASELWVWNGGGRLRLTLGGTGPEPAEAARETRLGPGDSHLVAPGEWQTAAPVDTAVRSVCVVSPGFDFADLEMWDSQTRHRPPSVLLVCEGNLCRSPTAELLLRRELEHRGLDVAVASAGLRTEAGIPIERHAARALHELGVLDTDAFRSRPFSVDLAGADLVLTATTAQRDDLARLAPVARDRTFAWRELLALGQEPVAPAGVAASERIADLLHQLRGRRGLVTSASDVDVPDPIGRSSRFFARTAHDIAADMSAVADLLAASLGPTHRA
jgi:protein-tyrosine-phosphatase/predicted cupin superfamily sugar epimerase